MDAGKKVAILVILVAITAVSVVLAGKHMAYASDGTATLDERASATHPGGRISFATHAAKCGTCHKKQYAEWRFAAGSDMKTVGQGSYHAISSTEPMYKAMLGTVDQSMQSYCKGCHEAGNAWGVKDRVNDIPLPRVVNVEEGINCLVCHYDGKKIVGEGDLQDPIFCATCHNEKTGLVDVYVEWLTDYKGGKTCQQCHMEEGSHLFLGYNSPSFVKKAIAVSEPVISGPVSAGNPFDISFTLSNNGTGHSVPEDLFRLLRARVSIENMFMQEVFIQETVYYKRNALFGENPGETVVIKAGETKQVSIPGVVITSPGVYTVKLELLQDSNRVNSALNTTAFMGASYRTIVVD